LSGFYTDWYRCSGHTPVTLPDTPGLQFCIVFCMKYSRLIGWYPLPFAGAGMNVILTSPQAIGIYLLARQALTCSHFTYLATGFDTLRMSYLFFSTITVCISMCTASKTHTDCLSSVPTDASHMQLYVRWQPYCRCFQISCARTPRQCIKFRLWPSCISCFWYLGFWNGFNFFGKFLNPSHKVYMYFIHPKSLWKQHEVLYGVCWLTAVLKMFETFNFT